MQTCALIEMKSLFPTFSETTFPNHAVFLVNKDCQYEFFWEGV